MKIDLQANQKGQGLIQVLVGIAIAGILVVIVASMLTSQQKNIQFLTQKQEAIDLKNLMLQQLTKTDVCTWQLKDKVINVSMPTTEASPSPTTIALASLYQGPNASSAVLAKAGQRLSGSQSGVKVASLSFKNIYATGNPDEYKGVFDVSFDPASLVIAVKPVQVSQIVKTVAGDPPSAKKIESCVSGGGVQRYDSGWFDAVSSDKTYVTGQPNPQNPAQSIPAFTLGRRADLVRLFYRKDAASPEVEVPTFQVSNAEATFSLSWGDMYGPITTSTSTALSFRYRPNADGVCFKFGPGLSPKCGADALGHETFTGTYYMDQGQLRIVAYVF